MDAGPKKNIYASFKVSPLAFRSQGLREKLEENRTAHLNTHRLSDTFPRPEILPQNAAKRTRGIRLPGL